MTKEIDIRPEQAEHFQQVKERALKSEMRRNILKGGLGLSALGALPFLSACGGGGSDAAAASGTPTNPRTSAFGALQPQSSLGFSSVGKSLADSVQLPPGYSFKVVHATGDRLVSSVTDYSNAGTELDDWSQRVGDHHDGMDIYYIDANGNFSETATNRAVLAVNHESSADAHFFHATGQTSGGVSNKKFSQFGGWDGGARPELEALKEINHHGVSIVELNLNTGAYIVDSAYNRRITAQTVCDITGPAAHLADIKTFMQTAFDTSGSTSRGTINNCGHGKTPWGTYLACEENWAFYFQMPPGASLISDTKAVQSRNRYGLVTSGTSDPDRSQGWYTAGSDNRFTRWNISDSGADATQDFRNEPNTFGYNTEIDPLDPLSRPAKRVAMGRFAHEACVASVPVVGEPLAFYMGCDSRNEYIYKFVTDAKWDSADIGRGIAAGNKYLTEGKLYAAKFNDDGTGEWLLLDISVPAIAGYANYAFANQADVLVNARHAADAVGATPMDRPEWGAVNPANGDVYFCLTNNRIASSGRDTDGANPRAYVDDGRTGAGSEGNPNGHIIRFKEAGTQAAATTLQWDIFLFGAEDGASADINISGLDASNAFSSPDGLWFSYVTGILWIQTDDGAFTDETNNMLLAAMPGKVGDGQQITVNNSATNGTNTVVDTQTTFVGAALGDTVDGKTVDLRRFLVGPVDCEITGLTETADGKAIFVNIQHPGEDTGAFNGVTFPFTSQWPSNDPRSAYAPGPRPRSATIMITKDDGGLIGT